MLGIGIVLSVKYLMWQRILFLLSLFFSSSIIFSFPTLLLFPLFLTAFSLTILQLIFFFSSISSSPSSPLSNPSSLYPLLVPSLHVAFQFQLLAVPLLSSSLYPLGSFLPIFMSSFAGSLESANSSILAPCDLFREVVGKKSGFYVN